MIAASPLSPDEYAMRIATQTESALICKEYSSPFIVSPISVFPAPQRTPSPMGRRAISLPEILILHRQHALYYSDTPPLRLPAYLRMCYRTSPYLIC
ncbi:hypothetical protein TNCV_1338801 [Trichonephila clavipes]|nr:hypothetical protein TNCV_1338801 [Trichonephila clavipes]